MKIRRYIGSFTSTQSMQVLWNLCAAAGHLPCLCGQQDDRKQFHHKGLKLVGEFMSRAKWAVPPTTAYSLHDTLAGASSKLDCGYKPSLVSRLCPLWLGAGTSSLAGLLNLDVLQVLSAH